MNWKGYGRTQYLHNLMYYSGICLEEPTKTTKNLSGQSVSGEIFEPGTSRHEAELLITKPQRSVPLRYTSHLVLFKAFQSRTLRCAEHVDCMEEIQAQFYIILHWCKVELLTDESEPKLSFSADFSYQMSFTSTKCFGKQNVRMGMTSLVI
jgi:hypothetical protein